MSELSPQEKVAIEAGHHALPPISPDAVEQDQGNEIDNIVPTHGYSMLPVVALGGSAGSIPALQRFFSAMPVESGMAFVVILHLAAEHESILDEILGRVTKMRVVQAVDGAHVEANTVYVIPPGKFLSVTDGSLRLTPMELERGKRVAVDIFFRTLADTHGSSAAAIILSGADGDGALGIKRIKERGGLTIAQDPGEADHPSMPRSAIDTGMVDWVLPVEEMPARLVDYRANATRLQLPSEDGPPPAKIPPTADEAVESALRDVLGYLRSRTGRDFSYYKRATVVRRISRRMQVNGVATMPEYLCYLRLHPGEATALQQDLLISVTNFFRDRECFEALEAELPKLLHGKGTGDTVRVWTAGCATGEEAFSIAMLLLEQTGRMDSPPMIQVFATDLADDAIATARDALYPFTIAADVSEERLRRFFTKEHRGYRVRRELRECVLFAAHDLLKDAPFSRLDLFTCRNLLIYLTPAAQERVLESAHFGLRPGGLLFIGTSETVDEEGSMWTPVDKKHRIYAQRPTPRARLPVPIGPSTISRAIEAQERARGGPFIHGSAFSTAMATALRHDAEIHEGQRVSWEELHFKLIERFAPPSLIITRDHDIVHMSENAGRFLHFSGGEPSVNLLRVVHPMLRVELRAALFHAAQANAPVQVFRVPVELDEQSLLVDLCVSPANEIAPDFLLVVFEVREMGGTDAVPARQEAEPAVRHLEREIEALKRRLRDRVEQYEANAEELKASNEELQAMNEEFRSSAEELETSREELQSVNEELTTVNGELKSKVDDLAHANSDLSNLMAATGVATIFLDRALRITRYTPNAVALFRLIPSDLNRPLMDLTHRLNYPDLNDDAKHVLETALPVKREVSDSERWFLAQLLPYRTSDDHVAGVVLTFVDITETRVAERALRESEARITADLAGMHRLYELQAKLADQHDLKGGLEVILAVACELTNTDRGCVQLLSGDGERLEMFAWRGYADDGPFISFFRHEGLEVGCEVARAHRQRLIIEDTTNFVGLVGTDAVAVHSEGIRASQATPMANRAGETIGVLSTQFRQPHRPSDHELRLVDMLAWTAAEFIERHRATAALRQSEEKYRTLFSSIDEGFFLGEVTFKGDGETAADVLYLDANPAAARIFGRDLTGLRLRELVPAYEEAWFETFGHVARTGEAMRMERYSEADGKTYDFYAVRIGDPGKRQIAVVFNDISARKRREAHLAFLAEIAEDLSRLSGADEVMQTVGAKIGAYLNVKSCLFVDVDDPRGEVTVFSAWSSADVPSLHRQTIRLSDFINEEFARANRAGKTVIIRDTQTDPRCHGGDYTALGLGAFVTVPFHRIGAWTNYLAVTDSLPRDWHDDEIELFRELSSRIFPRLGRARAEAELRKAEERLRLILESTKDYAIFTLDLERRVDTWNAGAEAIFGYTEAEMRGQSGDLLFVPEDLEGGAPGREAERALAEGRAANERWHLRKDGSRLYGSGVSVPLRNEAGTVVGFVKIMRDLTETMRAQDALAEAEQRLRTMADAVPQIIWANDGAGAANYFNRRWYEYSGLSVEESVGPGWQAIVHPEDAEMAIERWQSARGLGEVFDCEYRLRGRDGLYRWFIGRNVPARDGGGNITGWFGTATDIHDLKEAERALGEFSEQLRLIVENAHEHAIITSDLERNVLSWNPGAEHIVGFRAEEMIGKLCDILFLPEERAAGLPAMEVETALVEGRALNERWQLRKDGSRFWSSGVILPMRDRPGGEVIGFLKIFRDQTEVRTAQEALERSRQELWLALQETERARAEAETAGRAKDHFLAVLSHELRTPLTPVLMATQTLARRKDLSEPARDALEMIRRNIQLEAHLVDDLLDVTRISHGKLELARVPMDLHEAVQHAVEISQPDVRAKRQELTLALEAADDHLEGDPRRLRQVVWNLLKNASKFTPPAGRIHVRTRNEPGRIVVEVSDSGLGIEADTLPVIFDAFAQANVRITREFGGLGLGLAIAKATVDAHGGELHAESAGLGQGSTFIISLPLVAAG